jgi:hypothetical protein
MPPSWLEIAAWVAQLRAADIPREVLDTARHLQLGLLGAERRLATLGPRRGEIAWSAEVLGGDVGAGIGAAAWAAARARAGSTLGDLLVATVAGMEVGARAGVAASCLGAAPPGLAARVAGAVAVARLRGDDGNAVAAAIEGAVAGADLRLARARGDLGRAWLSRTAILPAVPAPAHAAASVEAVEEILGRHVRAAGKRLRADQVERVEISVPGLVLAQDREAPETRRIAALVAALLAHHSLLPGADGGDGGEIVGRVEVRRSGRGSVVAGVALAEAGAGIGMLGLEELRRAWSAGRLRPPGAREWARMAREIDVGAFAGAVAASGWDDGALARWRWALPVEVRLWTTRGGWWPERRPGPRGGGASLREVARDRWSAGNETRGPAWTALVAAPLDDAGWLEAAWTS